VKSGGDATDASSDLLGCSAMLSQKIATVFSVVALTGCANMPTLTSEDTLSTTHVVRTIECELFRATEYIRETNPAAYKVLTKWAAAFTLSMTVEEQNGVAPTFGVTGMPLNIGSAGVGTPISINNTSRRFATLAFGIKFKALRTFTCTQVTLNGHPLTSQLGFTEWLARTFAPFSTSDDTSQLFSSGETLTFILDTTGKISPGFTLVRTNNPTVFSNSAIFSASRQDEHKLEAVFKPLVEDL
jgi:hypothetical protein